MGFVLLFRSVKYGTQRTRAARAVTVISIIQWCFLNGVMTYVAIMFNIRLPVLPKALLVTAGLALLLANHYFLTIMGCGPQFEKDFDKCKPLYRTLLKIIWIVATVGSIVLAIHEARIYRGLIQAHKLSAQASMMNGSIRRRDDPIPDAGHFIRGVLPLWQDWSPSKYHSVPPTGL